MNDSNGKKIIKLVASAKGGDKKAFSIIYENYISPIYRFVYFRVKNRDDAEDLTQTIFFKAWNALPNYKQKKAPFSFYPVGSQGDSFGAWLYAIARNTITDYWKKKKELNIDNSLIDLKSEPVHDSIEKEEDIEIIKRTIALLSDDQQEIVILRFIEDFSHKEIAKLVEKKEAAVRQLQSRAIKTLKKHLEQYYG
jgi:RNA polymerase sigma-70 factor (ECF subfamily)